MSAASSKPAAQPGFPVGPLIGVISVVIVFFGSQIVASNLLAIVPALLGWSGDRISSWLQDDAFAQFLYFLIAEGLTVAALLTVMRVQKVSLRDIGLIKPKLWHLVMPFAALAVYFALNFAVQIVATSVFHLDGGQKQQLGFDSAKTTAALIFTFISLVILPPIAEEITMRGYLFGSLKRRFSVIPAALFTSLLFGFAHLQLGMGAPPLWTAALDTFVLSLVLCYLRQKTGNLWAGIALHMLKNLVAFLLLFVFPTLSI